MRNPDKNCHKWFRICSPHVIKCHWTTLWNVEPVHLIEVTLFSFKSERRSSTTWIPGKWTVNPVILCFHITVSVFFATDQSHYPPRCVDIQLMSKQIVRILDWYSVCTVHAAASCFKYSNPLDLDQDCWLAARQDWWTGMSHGIDAPLCHERDVLVLLEDNHISSNTAGRWQQHQHQQPVVVVLPSIIIASCSENWVSKPSFDTMTMDWKWNENRLQLRACFFSQKIVKLWNKLPATVVDASSVNEFKKRLDDWSIDVEF